MNAPSVSRTAAVEGMQLHYRMWGEGPPLVLLHGFTGSGEDWRHAFDLEALAARYRLIVTDLGGRGR